MKTIGKPSNRLGMYADVRQILDAALAAGGGSYECGTHGQAVHWRQRAYKFRKLYAEILGVGQQSEYDMLVMPRVEANSATVEIHIRKQVGSFRPAAEPVFIPTVDDQLFDIASDFASKLEGE